MMPSNHLILCHILLLPSIFPSIRVFSKDSVLRIRWPKFWSFSFSISPSNEYSGLISFRIDWLDLLAVQGTLKSSPTPQFKTINSLVLSFLYSPTLTSIHDYWKNHSLTRSKLWYPKYPGSAWLIHFYLFKHRQLGPSLLWGYSVLTPLLPICQTELVPPLSVSSEPGCMRLPEPLVLGDLLLLNTSEHTVLSCAGAA